MRAQLCLTLCHPRDCSPLGSSVHEIFQMRILEWIAVSFFSGSSRPRDGTRVSCVFCVGRHVLYHRATGKTISFLVVVVKSLSHVRLFAIHGLQCSRLPCPSLFTRVCSNSCPLSQSCHPTISFSVAPFSSCPQSFPASGSFPMNQFFASGGQSTGVSASASVFPMTMLG